MRPDQDQPDLDARYVYVGVHADGPTRILAFQDGRDRYTRETSEEAAAAAAAKLARAQERLQVVL